MKREDIIKRIAKDMLDKMMVEASLDLSVNNGVANLSVVPEEAGILIGRNGENLAALQHVLRLMINKELGEFTYLVVDIAGYKDKRRRELEDMADKTAQSTVKSGRVQVLVPMNSFERRIIHMHLSAKDDVETESIGEEPNRRIMIKVKKKALA
jgi:spoIIIJ-associated protein